MKKINIADLLKDCPKGMELDCTMYDNAKFIGIENNDKPICIEIGNGDLYFSLTKFGTWNFDKNSKCVVFPKGKTTWEGFVPPRKFKDGDIVVGDNRVCSYITIFRKFIDNTSFSHHVCLTSFEKLKVDGFSDNANLRLATDAEKVKLFQAIKDNGYRWNFQANKLEKLVIPNFKKGDKIRIKNGVSQSRIIEDVCDTFYTLVPIGIIDFTSQDNWELVPDKFDINTLVPFESKVLVRHTKDNKWCGSFFSFIDRDHHSYCYTFVTTAGKSYPMMIPYKGNEHLLGSTKDCDEYYKTWE